MLSLSLARLLYTLYWFLHLLLQNILLGLLATKAFPQCLHTFNKDFSSVSIKENIICTLSVFHEDSIHFSKNQSYQKVLPRADKICSWEVVYKGSSNCNCRELYIDKASIFSALSQYISIAADTKSAVPSPP